jgi:hypothetical protein
MRIARVAGLILLVVGVLNFIAFAVHCAMLGGSAGNGTVRDGRYFVSEHGKETEVSQTTFYWSSLHSKSVFISHPLAMIGLILFAASSSARAQPGHIADRHG